MTHYHLRKDPDVPKAMLRPCALCGFPMFLAVVAPSDTPGQDWRTFECAKCQYTETVTVADTTN